MPGPRPRLIRTLVILAVAAGALWATLSMTVALVIGDRSPEIALSWQGASAEAQAGRAWQLVSAPRARAHLPEAKALAEAALRREPGNVTAVRTLGLIAAAGRDQRRAERLFRYGESLSRRDLPTQLWLIESDVARNDIPAVLRHYDRALRTSNNARELLIPILAQASADPAVARPLGRTMAARPEWWLPAVGPIIAGNPNPATLPVFVEALRLDLNKEVERGVFVYALRHLVDKGQYLAASRMLARANGGGADGVRNGDFNNDRGLQPFDWVLVDDSGLGARVRPGAGPGNNGALFLIAESGRGGQVASQLMTLRPGRYRLRAVVGQTGGDMMSRPTISVGCARPPDRQRPVPPNWIAQLRFPQAGGGGVPVALPFQVPAAGCPAQWIALAVSSDVDGSGEAPWVDAIRVEGP